MAEITNQNQTTQAEEQQSAQNAIISNAVKEAAGASSFDMSSAQSDGSNVQSALNMMEGVDFSKILGGPLQAAINAQAAAAKSTFNFIKENAVTKDNTVVTVAFDYKKDGDIQRIDIPLLTLVPIPTFTIKEMDYEFKMNITSVSSSASTNSQGYSFGLGFDLNVDWNKDKDKADDKAATDGAGAQGVDGAAQNDEKVKAAEKKVAEAKKQVEAAEKEVKAAGEDAEKKKAADEKLKKAKAALEAANKELEEAKKAAAPAAVGGNAGGANNATAPTDPQAQKKKEQEEQKIAKEKADTKNAEQASKQSPNSFGLTGNFSTKKDSTSSQTSRYSVEATMDVRVKAGPDDLPAGVITLINVLNNSISSHSAFGSLQVLSKESRLTNGQAKVIVMYMNPDGVYDTNAVTCDGAAAKSTTSTKSVQFTFDKPGKFTIVAGSCSELIEIEDTTPQQLITGEGNAATLAKLQEDVNKAQAALLANPEDKDLQAKLKAAQEALEKAQK